MFKYCVWYVLRDNHILHQQIKRYAQVFDTEPFLAHITLRHSLDKNEAIDMYRRVSKGSGVFTPIGKPIVSSILIDNTYFYSIEQPLSINGKDPIGIHISLAYRMGSGFHPVELAIVGNIKQIQRGDLEVRVADCSSRHPKEWKILSI